MSSTSFRNLKANFCRLQIGMVLAIAVGFLLLFVCPANGEAGADHLGVGKATIRVVGPLPSKEMFEYIGTEFAKTTPCTLEYLRYDTPASVMGGFLFDRDLMLTLGKLTDKDIGPSKEKWNSLAPSEYVIGARAVAFIVHARNPVDSLTLSQIQLIFSGASADWKLFGGDVKPIKRYGLQANDPLTKMFQQKVIPDAKIGNILRKKDSKELLNALSSDPQAIAYVDAVLAASAGDAIKILAIGDGKAAVLPNAQTIKDGTYPLSETLMLYVSPKASDNAQGLLKLIQSGRVDDLFRRYGFMPTVRAVSADASIGFDKLYGADIKRVKATSVPDDDIALANQILQSVVLIKPTEELMTTMCDSAFDLSLNVSGGETVAFESLQCLWDRSPEKRVDCALNRALLYERAYKREGLKADAETAVNALMEVGTLGTLDRRFDQGAQAWRKALALAQEVNSPQLAGLKKQLPSFEIRVESEKKAAALEEIIKKDAGDVGTRKRLLMLYLVDLDNPTQAARFLDVADDETIKTNIPLARQPLDKHSEETALKIAEWYAGLVAQANAGGKELMTLRAQGYYLRFFELHTDRDDALATRAALGMQKMGGRVPELPAEAKSRKGAKLAGPVVRGSLKVGEEITAVRLAEFVADNPGILRVTSKEIGAIQRVSDLRPLSYLPELSSLELQSALGIKDFTPLMRLSKLTALTISGATIADLPALSSLPKLTNLDLNNALEFSDLSSIARLSQLRTLNLSGCAKISDLAPLSRLASLSSLNISDCINVDQLAPLEFLAKTLTSLNLSNCNGITNVEPIIKLTKLKALDLRGCEKIAPDDIDWLKKHLPECKIQSDLPLNEPTHVTPGR